MRRYVAALVLLSGVAHGADADDYAYSWALSLTGDSAAWQVELTPAIYAIVTTADLRDIAVLDAAGNPVPMAPHAAVSTMTAQASEAELPQFALPAPGAGRTDEPLNLHVERGPDGRLRRLDAEVGGKTNEQTAANDLLLDASALHAPIDSLWIEFDSDASVIAHCNVSASEDLQQWHSVADATVLSLHDKGNFISRRQIPLNGIRATYLRLHHDAHELPNLRVRARILARSTLIEPARVWLDAPLTATLESDKGAPSRFVYRLSAPLAIDAVKLDLAGDNSLARVRIESRTGDNWQTRAELVAFRLHQGDDVIGNDETPVSAGGRAQEWRVDPATPLDHPPTLHAAFRPDRFVFLAQGQGPYRLAAGSAHTRRGDYPIETALAQLKARLGADWQPPLATLGERATLAGDRALIAASAKASGEWKQWLLWAVLIGAAAVIGGLALSLLRGSSADR
jgi:Protein of unknown function (DUF3999)